MVACHICYGRFAAWQMKKYGWTPLSSKQVKRMDRKKHKAARSVEKALKLIAKKEAKELADREKLYGKPRDVQATLGSYRRDSATVPEFILPKGLVCVAC